MTKERTSILMDINYDRGKNCRKFRLLTWTSIIGQFVHPVGGENWGKGREWGDGSLF